MAADRPSNEERIAKADDRAKALLAADEQLRQSAISPADLELLAKCRTSREVFATACEVYADRPCLGYWSFQGADAAPTLQFLTYQQLFRRVESLATALRQQRLVAAQTAVGVSGRACAEWVIADLACLFSWAVSVPLPTDLASPQAAAIANHARVSCVICTADQLASVMQLVSKCRGLSSVVAVGVKAHQAAQVEELKAEMQRASVSFAISEELERLATRAEGGLPDLSGGAADEGDPPRTVIYTSGSTGEPEGIVYHERRWFQLWRAGVKEPSQLGWIWFQYAPLDHVFGRISVIRGLVKGGVTSFARATDPATLFEDIRRVRPTRLALVPRVSQMIYEEFQARCRAITPPAADDAARARLRAEVMGGMRGSFLGDRLLVISLWTARTDPTIVEFLQDCFEVPTYDSYGSSELGGLLANGRVIRANVAAFRLVDAPELGYRTTDQPWPRGELRVKLRESILSPSDAEQPELRVLRDEDGFYSTGDVFEQRGSEQLVWLDRLKNVFKLANGEFVSPARLETALAANCQYVHQIFVYGSSRHSFLVAVVVPNRGALQADGISLDDAATKKLLAEEFARVAKEQGLRVREVPRDLIIEHEPFTVQNGLLTRSGKQSRLALRDEYSARLEALCGEIEESRIEKLRK